MSRTIRLLSATAAAAIASAAIACSAPSSAVSLESAQPAPHAASTAAAVSVAVAPSPTPTPAATTAPTPGPTTVPTSSSSTGAALPGGPHQAKRPKLIEDFPREAFSHPTRIDNVWFPVRPGTQRTTKGTTGVGRERLPQQVVFTVTNLTKVIDGITTRVAYEEDRTDGQLTEAELIFLAQDDTGAVWLMGEYPEEVEDGKIVGTPTWLPGIAGAHAGIWMPATPTADTPSYSEGWGPAVGWTDRGRILEMGSRTCVPLRCFTDVLVINEYNPDTPDAHQLKYYARGAGNVRVGWAGALEDTQESLVLTDLRQLDAKQMNALHDKAGAMEKRAYRLSPDVYGKTAPLERSAD